MKSLKENFQKVHIVIIGAGIIGKFNALELSELGFQGNDNRSSSTPK